MASTGRPQGFGSDLGRAGFGGLHMLDPGKL